MNYMAFIIYLPGTRSYVSNVSRDRDNRDRIDWYSHSVDACNAVSFTEAAAHAIAAQLRKRFNAATHIELCL